MICPAVFPITNIQRPPGINNDHYLTMIHANHKGLKIEHTTSKDNSLCRIRISPLRFPVNLTY
jgi:hypothetical protein